MDMTACKEFMDSSGTSWWMLQTSNCHPFTKAFQSFPFPVFLWIFLTKIFWPFPLPPFFLTFSSLLQPPLSINKWPTSFSNLHTSPYLLTSVQFSAGEAGDLHQLYFVQVVKALWSRQCACVYTGLLHNWTLVEEKVVKSKKLKGREGGNAFQFFIFSYNIHFFLNLLYFILQLINLIKFLFS